ncbi:MAG: hypothetical protein AB4352_15880 [Hormoscilla sp.]
MPCPYHIRSFHTCDRPMQRHAQYMRSPHKLSPLVGARHQQILGSDVKCNKRRAPAQPDRPIHAIAPCNVMPNTCDRPINCHTL